MKRKLAAILLAVCMILALVPAAGAACESGALAFNENGKFTIVHLTDIQDGYPMYETIHTYIEEMLASVRPDLVVLGGDNCVCKLADKDAAIKELCDLFVNSGTYFTLVFGNHDHQQGMENDELLARYIRYGGEYCLAYDAVPELHGCGTHNLPVYSSDGSRVAYNLYMFDSGDSSENDEGYDCVHEDQINWYKGVCASLKEANGGKVVPAMAFQHIIVQEAAEELFIKSAVSLGEAGLTYDNAYYTYLPKCANIKEGYLLEHVCPGYYNYGQFDAMVECGDVKAVFSGHDHTNSFILTRDGIDIVNTGGCTYNSYGSNLNRGCRVIVLDEKDLSTYETYTLTLAELALRDGSKIADGGDISISEAKFSLILDKFLSALMSVVKVLFFFVK